jgi:hypothetical protein
VSWFDIALWIVFGLIATGLLLVGAWIVAILLVDALRRTTPGAPVGEAPDPVDAHADTVPIERSTPWTGDNVTVQPAIWVPDSQLIRDAYAAIDAYRHGQDPGGAPELSPLTRWTERGWVPIADWRLARTDKRWW